MEPPVNRSVKERWAILRKALLEKKATAENFDKDKSLLLVKEILPHVFEYGDTRLKIYPPNLKVSASTLTGFNNTGNVRIWPAEEAMIDYVHKNIPEKTLKSANIVELGGGFSNLCGQFLAKKYPESTCYLTDGNHDSVEHCSKLIQENQIKNAICQVLRWDQPETFHFKEESDCNNNDPENINVLLVADCFFFDEYRLPLANCVKHFIDNNPSVKVVVIGPTRNGTFEDFLRILNGQLDKSSKLQFSTPEFYPADQSEIILSVYN
jgi:hypothetical protein